MGKSKIELIKKGVNEFYVEIEKLHDKYHIPTPIKSYLVLDPDYKKERHNVTLCFRQEPQLDKIVKAECIAIFERVFPYPLREGVLESIPCEEQGRS
jgi:hypothetical protein